MQHNVSLPAWSDAPELVKDGVLHVSIHVPAWGATTEFLAMRLPTMFQSTLPRGERLTTTQTIYLRYLFQSTLPRGERLLAFGTFFQEDFMFQSTLPRGERPLAALLAASSEVFQSTLPRGERRRHSPAVAFDQPVSIHAPAWGATRTAATNSFSRACFNPRSRVGSDFDEATELSRQCKFQSTLPRGERLQPAYHLRLRRAVSIHAPAWGATELHRSAFKIIVVSIHAPAWGATAIGASDIPLG